MILRRSLTKAVIASIKSDRNFAEIYEIARKNAYGPVYLVGGKVYRTLIEKIHGYSVQAARSDWDFLVLGQVRRTFIPGSWTIPQKVKAATPKASVSLLRGMAGPMKSVKPMSSSNVGNIAPMRTVAAIKSNSLTLVNPSIGMLDNVKVDLIAIRDIVDGTKGGYTPGRYARAETKYGLKEYFDAVPLNVQCIALDLEGGEIHANRALGAIESKILRVNNEAGALPGLNIGHYIDHKAMSLGFRYDFKLERRVKCTCWSWLPTMERRFTLFNRGCQLTKAHY